MLTNEATANDAPVDVQRNADSEIRVRPEPARMSYRLWGLDWTQHMPWDLEGGAVVEPVSFDEALPFIQEHFPAIFEQGAEPSRFFEEPLSSAKLRFYREADAFLFRDGDRNVALVLCHPTDWSTYYVRTAAFLPSYQGRGLLNEWFRRMFHVLADAGVDRMEAEVAPSTFPTTRLLTGLGFNITATTNTDRWGSLVRFTKYLNEAPEMVFLDQFCTDVQHQRRNRSPQHERRTP